jgi:hypothetical protein
MCIKRLGIRLVENPLHNAGADAELLADLQDAIALIPERHDLSLD